MKMHFFTIFIILLISVCQAFQSEMTKEKLTITSGEITGKFTIPPGPEYLHNAVFYQIYPQPFMIATSMELVILKVLSKNWIM